MGMRVRLFKSLFQTFLPTSALYYSVLKAKRF